MAASIRSQDVREKVIKEGVLRYRQSSLYLQRWKPRYVVFKITHSGRLQLIIYKEQPAIPVNEIKEVPIDEFGGLESNLSLDNEKFAFAIITTHVTESFSAESPHEMTEWTTLLQEYLGKELLLNIYIPSKQNILKSGRAQLRVRNTGFTITTCDNPPRCQGTWQIIHIRKYGGSDHFRFQSGSKCPTGEFLYTIQTDDNLRLKNLFNDLSQHRPIFTDDRVGRRMTLERSFDHKVGLHSRVANRFSLQQASEHEQQRVYQNHEAFAFNSRHNSAGLTVEAFGRRHSATEGEIFNPHATQPSAEQAQKSINSGSGNSDDVSNRQYQNVHHLPRQGRSSPTKRIQHTVMKPLPEKYYSVAPPQALKKYRTSVTSTPPSSPDDDGLVRTDLALDENTPVSELEEYEHNEAYVDVNSELSVKVEGDSLVVQKALPLSPVRKTGFTPAVADASHYQNLAFMQGNSKVSQAAEDTDGSTRMSSTFLTNELDAEGAHSYTNVEFTHEKSRRIRDKLGEENNWALTSSPIASVKEGRKISAPAGPSNKPCISRTEKLTSSLELPTPSLRNSHSNYELNKAGIQESLGTSTSERTDESQAVFDYYNILVPHLPANSSTKAHDIHLKNKFKSASLQPNGQAGDSLTHSLFEEDQKEVYIETDGDAAKLKKQISSDLRSDISGTSKSPSLSPLPSQDSCHNSNYDTLAPRVNGSDTSSKSPPQPLYDSLLPKSEAKSASSSPEPCSYSPNHLNKTYQYNRKVQLLQRGHKYEYIDVELQHGEKVDTHHGKKDHSSPVRKEHPSSWMASPVSQDSTSVLRMLPKLSSQRKKQLPLQESPIENENDSSASYSKDSVNEPSFSAQNSKPQVSHSPKGTSNDTNCESPKSPRKPQPLPRKGVYSKQPSSELVYSIDSYMANHEMPVPLGHSDVDSLLGPTVSDTQGRSFSPLQRSTHEAATPKIKSVQVELVKERQDCDNVELPALPPKPGTNNFTSEESSPYFKSPSPALPPRPVVDSKDLNDQTTVFSSSSTQRLSEPGIKLPLPQKEIHFNPPVPPRPRVLCPPSDNSAPQKYVAISFSGVPVAGSTEYHEVQVHTNTSAMPTTLPSDSSEERVEYTLVDFKMTYGLGKTIEQVEDRKRGFPDPRQ